MLQLPCALIGLQGLLDIDSEFVFLEPGRNVRMRFGIDIGIYAKRDSRLAAQRRRAGIDGFEFLGGLDVEHENVFAQSVVDLGLVFPTPE